MLALRMTFRVGHVGSIFAPTRDAPIVTDVSIKIDTSESPKPPRKQRGWLFWFLTILLISTVFITVVDSISALLVANHKAEPEKQAAPAPTNDSDQPTIDESTLQWASPTSGSPLTLEYVPQGTQVLFNIRPRQLLLHPDGEKTVAALGDALTQAIQIVESQIGVKFDQLDGLLVAFYPGKDHWEYSLRVTLTEPWGDGKIAQRQKSSITGNRAIFLPAEGEGRVIISCPQSLLKDLESQAATPAILPRDLERLLSRTDADRTATLLMSVSFLESGARELFSELNEQLALPIREILPDDAGSILFSASWRDQLFLELQVSVIQTTQTHRYVAMLKDQLCSADAQVVEALKAQPLSTYAETIGERFPEMIKTVCEFARFSSSGNIAVVRCYLPAKAGHNLLLAARLVLNEMSKPTSVAVAELSLSERLDQRMSLVFPKETFQNALEMLASGSKMPIQVDGRDLQLEGVTMNQTLSLDLRDMPAKDILVELLRKANPDREAQGPADSRQKLIYVIRGESIVVTTRRAAAERAEELPEVFRVRQP